MNEKEVFEYYEIPYRYPYLNNGYIFVNLYSERVEKELVQKYIDQPHYLRVLNSNLSCENKIDIIKQITMLWKLLNLDINDELVFFQSMFFLLKVNKDLYFQGFDEYCDIELFIKHLPSILESTRKRREEYINDYQFYTLDYSKDYELNIKYQVNSIFTEFSKIIGKEHIMMYYNLTKTKYDDITLV
jgi:hypothetical protein